MGFRRVLVLDGKFNVPGTFLEFQVFDKDGQPVSFDYRGQAWVDGNYFSVEQGSAVFEYQVAQTATTESHEQQLGWDYARTQKRQRWPKDKSRSFYSGYAECWRYRKGTAGSQYPPQDCGYRGAQ